MSPKKAPAPSAAAQEAAKPKRGVSKQTRLALALTAVLYSFEAYRAAYEKAVEQLPDSRKDDLADLLGEFPDAVNNYQPVVDEARAALDAAGFKDSKPIAVEIAEIEAELRDANSKTYNGDRIIELGKKLKKLQAKLAASNK
jgi:hypothetical protein